jgi:hypothetical protein
MPQCTPTQQNNKGEKKKMLTDCQMNGGKNP